MNLLVKTAQFFVRKEFCRTAIYEKADLSLVKEKLTLTVITGLCLIVLSCFFVVPAFIVIGIIAVKLKKPMIGVIGIPVSYGFSWLLLMLGMYMTGTDCAKAVGKWLTRIALEKMLGDEAMKVVSDQPES